MAKSLVVNCTTGKTEIVDVPDEIKPIEENPFDDDKHERTKAAQASNIAIRNLAGRDIEKMSSAEQVLLLKIVCQLLGITDENNIVRSK